MKASCWKRTHEEHDVPGFWAMFVPRFLAAAAALAARLGAAPPGIPVLGLPATAFPAAAAAFAAAAALDAESRSAVVCGLRFGSSAAGSSSFGEEADDGAASCCATLSSTPAACKAATMSSFSKQPWRLMQRIRAMPFSFDTCRSARHITSFFPSGSAAGSGLGEGAGDGEPTMSTPEEPGPRVRASPASCSISSFPTAEPASTITAS
mmetsp:Transcript_136474/g.254820  ORF Transcript_136474/g.254820 Transcript_136474/m.254820 type:complete len:208 (-) Transcript_136474:1071-1694(-)